MSEKIVMRPIGYIRSPYKRKGEAPRQSTLGFEEKATLELLPEFVEGARDIAPGSYGVIVFHFHLSDGYDLVTLAQGIQEERGVFSTRSPHRPNGIGISVVRFTEVKNGVLTFSGVDMLDKTPVLDIKPYHENLYPRTEEPGK